MARRPKPTEPADEQESGVGIASSDDMHTHKASSHKSSPPPPPEPTTETPATHRRMLDYVARRSSLDVSRGDRRHECQRLLAEIRLDLKRLEETYPADYPVVYAPKAEEANAIEADLVAGDGNVPVLEERLRQICQAIHVDAWR